MVLTTYTPMTNTADRLQYAMCAVRAGVSVVALSGRMGESRPPGIVTAAALASGPPRTVTAGVPAGGRSLVSGPSAAVSGPPPGDLVAPPGSRSMRPARVRTSTRAVS